MINESRTFIAPFDSVFEFAGFVQEQDEAFGDAFVAWGPENCVGCEFLGDLRPVLVTTNTRFTVDAIMVFTPLNYSHT